MKQSLDTKNIKFIDAHDLESRKKESESILGKYPDRVPIIVEKSENCFDLMDLDKNKFLAPKDINFGQFQFSIRKRMNLSPEKALFFFTNNIIIQNTENISVCYEQHKQEDGFMYVVYTSENTFGADNIP